MFGIRNLREPRELSQPNQLDMVGERGFEPPTPWSRTRCSTRLSHSPTEVSIPILLHVTSNVLCSENPETWDHWDHPPARTVLEPAPFADEMRRRSACIRTWFSGSSVLLAPAGDLPASHWPEASRRGRAEMRASPPGCNPRDLRIGFPDISPELARESGFLGVLDLLKVAKHGKGENIYLVRFHYVPPTPHHKVRRSGLRSK